jgi:3-oxo-5-alpha-steroid 4-dehydrogenase 1
MNEQTFYNGLLMGWFAIALLIFITLFYIVAPYGRHTRKGWGLAVSNRLGWLLMESMSPLVFAACFMFGSNSKTITLLVFFCMWEAHYIHRSFIYPFSLRNTPHQMPVLVIGMGLFFNAVNAYLNGRYLFTFSHGYNNEWLTDPRFLCGLLIFIIGFVINRDADQVLRSLRRSDEADYKVANGGMYRFISCPNYLGEIMIWVGWAIATWSLAGLSFAVWTIANLVPRARANHNWYRENFPEYPSERKALVPHLW